MIVGDLVKTSKGPGIITSIPNEAIAWVHLEGAPKGNETGFALINLEKIMENCHTCKEPLKEEDLCVDCNRCIDDLAKIEAETRFIHNNLESVVYTENPSVSLKKDAGKYDPTMLTLEMIELVSRVREFGAKKYARNNFKITGFKYTRSLAAALRHIFAYLSGEDNDPESGLSHLGHAICCLEHCIYDTKHHPENDDRK